MPGCALLLVVDVAGEREPELGMVEDAVGEPPRDEPRPDDQRALPQGGGAVSGHRARPTGSHRRSAAQAIAPKNAPAAGRPTSISVSRPNTGHETARHVSMSRGASLMPLAHARRSSRAYSPQRNAAIGHATATTTASRSVCGSAGARDHADEHAADQAGDDVGHEEQAAQLLEAPTRRVGAGREQLELDALSVYGHQAASPTWLTLHRHPYLDLRLP